jgi:hypothetical protein
MRRIRGESARRLALAARVRAAALLEPEAVLDVLLGEVFCVADLDVAGFDAAVFVLGVRGFDVAGFDVAGFDVAVFVMAGFGFASCD